MEHHKDVEKMISKVMSKKDLPRNAAIGYMLGVATGRLAALWRYDESLPEGKQSKGILTLAGRKKRAEKSPKISNLPTEEESAPKTKKTAKPAKKRKSTKKQRKSSEASEISKDAPVE